MKDKSKKKYYYELTSKSTGENFFCSVSEPIRQEALPKFLNLRGYTAMQVSRQYFESETADDESI